MRRLLGWAAAGLLLVSAEPGGAAPDGPHAYMEDQARCGGCHRVERDGEDWILDPHIFVVNVNEVCRVCHPPQQMGRSHAVGMNPLRTTKVRKLPPQLPLQLRDGERAETMTCGTCHNPHLPRHSRQKLFPPQPAAPGRPGEYLTYYLRIRSADPRDGFTALCRSCHPKL